MKAFITYITLVLLMLLSWTIVETAHLVAPVNAPGSAQQDGKTNEALKASLPMEVRQAMDRAASVYQEPLRGARWSKSFVLNGSEHPLYQLQGVNERGKKIEMEVTSAGRIIEVEEHDIAPGEVPGAVLDAVKTKLPHFKTKQLEAIYQNDKPQPVCFGIEGIDASGKKRELYISADGKTFLTEPVEDAQ